MLIEEDFTNDEVENELAPISVQLAFVQQVKCYVVLTLISSDLHFLGTF